MNTFPKALSGSRCDVPFCRRLSIWLLLLLVSASLCSATPLPIEQPDNSVRGAQGTVPTKARVDKAVELAAVYLKRSCTQQGRFAYEVDAHTGKEISSTYDVIRHAAAMYGLELLNRSHPDQEAVDRMVRAAAYMQNNYMAPGPMPGQSVVWMLPTHPEPQDQYTELGATALGVVALAELRRVRPDAVSLDLLQSMGRFLIFLQHEDGSFIHKYNLRSGEVPNWRSPFYPGETIVAFVELYETDHSQQWLDAAGKALAFMIKQRKGLFRVPTDHWAVIGTAALMPYADQVKNWVSREEMLTHVARICESIVEAQLTNPTGTGLDGAFEPTGSTSTTGTRMEALLTAREFLPEGGLQRKIDRAVQHGIDFLLRMQINSGPLAGGMPGAFIATAKEGSAIRIDFVEHALSAWLRFR